MAGASKAVHGALLASVAANKGVWKDPVLFEPDANAPPQPRPPASGSAEEVAGVPTVVHAPAAKAETTGP